MDDAPIAVAGATGYVGTRLTRRLAEQGRPVRALSRSGGGDERPPAPVEHRSMNVGDEDAVAEALSGCRIAYYLVYAMGGGADFEERDRRQAGAFARGARRAGVEKVVYLGGLGGADGAGRALSRHLASRKEVGRVLARAGPGGGVARRRDPRFGQRFVRNAALAHRTPPGHGDAPVGAHAHPAHLRA